MEQVKTAREAGFDEPKVGYEWNAGDTPPGDSSPGRWTARREENKWVISFYAFSGPTYVIHTFPPTEDGERAAKIMALKLVGVAWGRA